MTESHEYRAAQLQALIDALERFIPLARQDNRTLELAQLDHSLKFAWNLATCGFAQNDLDELSNITTELFSGAGGLLEARAAAQPEAVRIAAEETYQRALALRLPPTDSPN